MFLTVLKSLVAPSGRAKMPTVDAIRRALDEANAERIAAEADVRKLEASRLLALIDPDRRAAHSSALADARRRGEDAAVAAEELERRLGEAEVAEREAGRRAAYEAAKARRDAVAATFPERYEAAIGELAALLREVAEADAEVDRVNDNLPEGADALDDVESIRDRPGLPRKIKSKTIVELWASPNSSEPIPEEMQRLVKVEKERGVPTGRGYMTNNDRAQGFFSTSHYVRKRFERVVFLDSVLGEAGPRLRRMDLPALRAGEPDIYVARPLSSPAGVLAALDKAAATPIEQPEREPQEQRVEFRLVEEPQPAAPPEASVPQSYAVPDFGQSVN